MTSTIGAEIELILVDKKGYVSNKALEILCDPRIENVQCYAHEGTLAQVEVNSDPAPTIKQLHQDLIQKLVFLDQICQEYGVRPIPMSEMGAGKGEINLSQQKQKERIPIYESLFGKKNVESLLTNSGVHLHFSQTPGREIDQYLILQSLEFLAYALTSTSPINHKGNNSLNDHRINYHRNIVFADIPEFSHLSTYPSSLEDIKNIQNKNFQKILQKAIEKGITEEEFNQSFKPHNLGYQAVRNRPEIGLTGTNELRSPDACTIDVLTPVAALFKGIYDYVTDRNLKVVVADEMGNYRITKKESIIPHPDSNQKIQNTTIEDGIKPDFTIDLLRYFLPFAEKGLSSEDQPYLQSFHSTIKNRENPANQVMQHLNQLGYTGSHFGPEQTSQAAQFMRAWHQKTLNYQSTPN